MAKKSLLRYLGTHSLAQQYWCHQFFIFHSIQHEDEYKGFAISLAKASDGIVFIKATDRLDKKEFVQIDGQTIQQLSVEEINHILDPVGLKLGPMGTAMKTSLPVMGNVELGLFTKSARTKNISDAEFKAWKRECKKFLFTIYSDGNLNQETITNLKKKEGDSQITEHMKAGNIGESSFAEKYDGAVGCFYFGNFIIASVPDGVTEEFCYEKKTTGSLFLQNFVEPIAIAQANLYSYFFNRPEIRVQIQNKQTGQITTIQKLCDKEKAEDDLQKGIGLLRGEIKPIPPKTWKCKNCEYHEKCPIAP